MKGRGEDDVNGIQVHLIAPELYLSFFFYKGIILELRTYFCKFYICNGVYSMSTRIQFIPNMGMT